MSDNKELMATAEQALKEKYGTAFKAVDIRKENEDRFEVWLREESHPGLVARAAMNNDGTGINDNYVAKVLCHRITDMAEQAMKDYPGDIFIYTVNMMLYVNETDVNIDFKTYLDAYDGVEEFDIYIFVERPNIDYEKLYSGFEAIRKKCNLGSGYIEAYALQNGTLNDVQHEIESFDELSGGIKKYLTKAGYVTIPLSESEAMPAADSVNRGLRDE